MATINEKIDIVADQVTVFNIYLDRIDEWWPRQKTYRYSFAPPETAPDRILFEPRAGGRFYERFADGTEYTIGTIIVFDPPNELTYTWKAPDWAAPSTVRVRFVASGDVTTVMVEHSDLPDDETASGYAVGQAEILSVFAAFVEE
jgi:uncharacterized protein YndB with AHSA1/START domain